MALTKQEQTVMALTKEEQLELLETMELTPEEKLVMLIARLRVAVFPIIRTELKRDYSWVSRFRDANGDFVFVFKSSESPTLELRIKGE